MSSNKLILNIITVTYNSEKCLPDLIASLQAQTIQNFEWIVADGNSSDGTITLLEQTQNLSIKWHSEPDFGIYDAMNKAIRRSTAEYYLIVGSDDVLAANAVELIVRKIKSDISLDVLVGQAIANGKLFQRKPGRSWLYGAASFVNAHSVGTVFKKNLHERFGYYSNRYAILADGYFMKTIFQSNQINVKYVDDVYGTFGTNGISNTATLQSYVENLHIQLITEKYPFLQILLFTIRYIKYSLKNYFYK